MKQQFLRHACGVLSYTWSHPANRSKRLKSLYRAVRFQYRGRLGKRTLADIGDHGKMWAELHYTASSSVLYANPPDWNEMQAWRRLIRSDDLFIDIGSNVGSYALWIGGLGAHVIAVEPNPAAAARLRENVGINEFDVEVLECALASETGCMDLTTELDTVNHLVMKNLPEEHVVHVFDEHVVNVEVRTLDDLLDGRHARGIKIDVEGAERLVLAGGRRALADQRIGFLQIEWNRMSQALLGEDRSEVAALLRSNGYRFYRPDEDGILHPADDSDYGSDIFALAPYHAATWEEG